MSRESLPARSGSAPNMKTGSFIVRTDPKTVGILGFDGVNALDLIGPLEVFETVNNCGENQFRSGYDARIIAVDRKSFVSETGVNFKARHTLLNAPSLDTVIVPGGKGVRAGEICRKIARWLVGCSVRIKRIAAISTGVFRLPKVDCLMGAWSPLIGAARMMPPAVFLRFSLVSTPSLLKMASSTVRPGLLRGSI